MNTKKRNQPDQIKKSADNAKKEIDKYQPDILIASDDNAQSYLVVPHYRGTDLPVVFCGVNARISDYGYPAKNITGMKEVSPVNELVTLLRQYSKGGRIGYIAGNTATEQKLLEIYNREFFNGKMVPYLVNTWDAFKHAFIQAQSEVDILFFSNYSGITNWEPGKALSLVKAYTQVPTGSDNPFMEEYVVCTQAKFPEEQGRHAAVTALKIMSGKNVSGIPVTANMENRLTVNLGLAQQAGITFHLSMLEKARRIE